MPDESDPPRKHYGFKDREFQRDNPLGAEGAPPTVEELAKLAGPVTRTTPAKSGAKAGDPNDVFTALQRNRIHEQRTGADDIEIERVRSRRQRDFWLVLVGGNTVIVGAVFATNVNVVTVIFGLAGVIIFSLSLAWIMFQVMDRY